MEVPNYDFWFWHPLLRGFRFNLLYKNTTLSPRILNTTVMN